MRKSMEMTELEDGTIELAQASVATQGFGGQQEEDSDKTRYDPSGISAD